MDKFNTYSYLLLALISIFLLGTYADAVLYDTREIELHRWLTTSFFGCLFLSMFLTNYKNEKRNTRS